VCVCSSSKIRLHVTVSRGAPRTNLSGVPLHFITHRVCRGELRDKAPTNNLFRGRFIANCHSRILGYSSSVFIKNSNLTLDGLAESQRRGPIYIYIYIYVYVYIYIHMYTYQRVTVMCFKVGLDVFSNECRFSVESSLQVIHRIRL